MVRVVNALDIIIIIIIIIGRTMDYRIKLEHRQRYRLDHRGLEMTLLRIIMISSAHSHDRQFGCVLQNDKLQEIECEVIVDDLVTEQRNISIIQMCSAELLSAQPSIKIKKSLLNLLLGSQDSLYSVVYLLHITIHSPSLRITETLQGGGALGAQIARIIECFKIRQRYYYYYYYYLN